MNHVILGYGQIGHAIAQHLRGTVHTYDIGWEATDRKQSGKVDILHLCIPYSDDYVKTAKQAKRFFRPGIVIVHSTVKPGTTAQIGGNALYSPVNGRHDDGFAQNVWEYPKFFAGSRKLFDRVSKGISLSCEYWAENRNELEYAKIMCTTYMFHCLLYEKAIHADCSLVGYDFNRVYRRWNLAYNRGMDAKHPNWKRPIYEHVDDPLPGGHCLTPNVYLADNMITRILREYIQNVQKKA